MNTNALRQKILDLAIHGKLVKQNPDDESAAILLEKIRAEKEKKIASGELKRGKNDSYIFLGDDNRHYEKFADGRVKDIEDEIPFAEPEGWAWCRLGNYIDVRDGTHDSPKYVETGYPFVTSKNLINGKIDFSNVQYISEQDHKNYIQRSHVEDNDILFAMIGSIGNPVLIKKDREFSIKNVALFKAYEKKQTDMKFVLFFLLWIQEGLKKIAKGGMQPFIPLNLFRREIFITLPPLAEQQRIVAKIETIFAEIDLMEQNKADLQTAVKQAKSKILDLAIRGKLVPQDTADEPASVMLEKLRAEKEAKIAAGEIKRDKNDSYIYKNSTDNCYYEKFFGKNDVCIDNEILFELPAKWQWCRLGEVCDYGKCENIEVSKLKPDDWILDLEDIEKDSGKIITFHSFAERRSESTKHIFREGDLLYSKLRPYLNKVVIAPKDGFCTSEILPLNFNGVLLNEFAQRLLMSFFFLSTVNMLVYGVKMPRLGRDDAKKIFIPIPPISEQKRIVAKIEEIFNALDDIQRNLV